MAARYSKDKYARIKNLKKEPLANLTSDLKKRKLSDEKAETAVLPPVHVAPSSPSLSLEVIAITSPITCAKGKDKVGRSVWNDPATALGRAHNVITNDELKGLSSIPSHKLVSRHIHKLVQVCGFVLLASLLYLSVQVSVHSFPPYLFPLDPWGVTAYHNWLFEHGGEGRGGYFEGRIHRGWMLQVEERFDCYHEWEEWCELESKGAYWGLACRKGACRPDGQRDSGYPPKDWRGERQDHLDKIIQKFKQLEEFSDLQFMQYFKGFKLLHGEQWSITT